jgi:spore coat protein U-like protein
MLGKIIILKINMLKIISIILASFIFVMSAPQAATSVGNTKATATLAAMCTISTQNITFGNLILPVSAQSATSSMSVLCSNKATYTIGLAYGGVYGQPANNGNGVWQVNPYGNQPGQYFYWYTGSTKSSGIIGSCATAETFSNNLGEPLSDTNYTCGQTGSFNMTSYYSYGKMIGLTKGDSIAYSIEVPGEPSEVWNTGNYTYSSTGNGSTQTIPVKATIVPAQNATTYPTPDTYMDTVTALVSF